MLKVPVEKIVARIAEEKGLSESEIMQMIETKYNQLAGLVSKDGAAHIVANEQGVKILEADMRGPVTLAHISPGARNLEVVGRVMQVYELKTFTRGDGTEGQLASFILGDATGTLRVVGWGKHADAIPGMEKGTPVKIVSCYTRENLRGKPEIHLNERSELIKNPTDVDVPEVKPFVQEEATRKAIKDLQPDDQNIELMGSLIQLFNPTFYEVCPTCNRRVRANEQGLYVCQQHGMVTPGFSCVFNAYLDDSTGNLRCVFFRNQFERLVNKPFEEILLLREDPQKTEELKNALLGNTVKVVGKAQHNEMFDRTEFIVQQVFPEPDLQKEMERLKQELKE